MNANFINSESDVSNYFNYFNQKFRKEAQKILTKYIITSGSVNYNFPIRKKSENRRGYSYRVMAWSHNFIKTNNINVPENYFHMTQEALLEFVLGYVSQEKRAQI